MAVTTPSANHHIIITGGGTGGHVFPAIAIAQELIRRGYSILYVGSEKGMEATLAPTHKIPFLSIRSVQVKNKGLWQVFKGSLVLLTSIRKAVAILKEQKPQAVIGVGGYVSVPVAVAAFLTRIPLYLQEQNASVGIANRFLGKLAKKIFLGFENAQVSFPEKRCLVSGNPIRSEFNRPLKAIDFSTPSLFVFGGSQGAKAINDAMMKCLPGLLQRFPDLKVVHQTGLPDFERVQRYYQEKMPTNSRVAPFINDMIECYENAWLVVSRAGALTISELLAVRRPALLVPYPRRGQNDQVDNAYLLEALGVGHVVEQGPEFEERFEGGLKRAFDRQAIENMEKSFSPLPKVNALATIGDHLEQDLRSGHKAEIRYVP